MIILFTLNTFDRIFFGSTYYQYTNSLFDSPLPYKKWKYNSKKQNLQRFFKIRTLVLILVLFEKTGMGTNNYILFFFIFMPNLKVSILRNRYYFWGGGGIEEEEHLLIILNSIEEFKKKWIKCCKQKFVS